MKLEIELDLNKIDYDSINKQIQSKIAAMNLEETYQINQRIKDEIDKQVIDIVKRNMYSNYWRCDIEADIKEGITDELRKLIKDALSPQVNEVFNKISNKELNQMFIEIFPLCYINIISTLAEHTFYKSRDEAQSVMNDLITNRLTEYIHK